MAHTSKTTLQVTLTILTAGALLSAGCEYSEQTQVVGHTEQNALGYNWLGPNWLGPNWLGPNWLGPNGGDAGNYTFNGLSLNPDIEVGLSVNGTGLDANALDGLVVNSDLTLHGQSFSIEQEQGLYVLVSYLTQCALAAGQNITMTMSDGTDVTFAGALALAPEWQNGALTDLGKRAVSACIAARSNAQGRRVHISLRGAGIQTHPVERATFRHVEGSFWGNIFGSAAYVRTCTADGGGVAGRDCTDGQCFFEDMGSCSDACTQWDAAEGAFSGCDSEVAVVTTYLPLTHNDGFVGDHTCAIDADGTVSCSGANRHGQLGNGTTTDSDAAQAVNLDVAASEIVSGDDHTCARQRDGVVRCWGLNKNGQVGDGSSDLAVLSPAAPLVTDAMSVRAGADHTCALDAEGAVQCWGENKSGQLGTSGIQKSNVPVLADLGAPALAIAAGNNADHTCAIDATSALQCWGENKDGQLGDGSHNDSSTPSVVRDSAGNRFDNVISACTTTASTCALQADGMVSCFGALVGADTPVSLAQTQPATAISCNADSVCAELADGTSQCW